MDIIYYQGLNFLSVQVLTSSVVEPLLMGISLYGRIIEQEIGAYMVMIFPLKQSFPFIQVAITFTLLLVKILLCGQIIETVQPTIQTRISMDTT